MTNIYNQAFALGEKMKLHKVEYQLYPLLWQNIPSLNIHTDWTTIKYLTDNCSKLNSAVNMIPNDKGGLYMFVIKCPILIGITEYPVYIGRAQITKNQNLRKRCKEYFQKFYRGAENRLKIYKMLKYWGEYLYLSYLTEQNNQTICQDEAQLINGLLLPFNDQIPDKQISQANKAF